MKPKNRKKARLRKRNKGVARLNKTKISVLRFIENRVKIASDQGVPFYRTTHLKGYEYTRKNDKTIYKKIFLNRRKR